MAMMRAIALVLLAPALSFTPTRLWARRAVPLSSVRESPAEDLANSLSRDNVDVLARLASRTNHLDMEDIEMCRALPVDDSHLLIEAMTCVGDDHLCHMHAIPVDIPDECVLADGISADCVVDALENREGGQS
jgi:hypothetical protein